MKPLKLKKKQQQTISFPNTIVQLNFNTNFHKKYLSLMRFQYFVDELLLLKYNLSHLLCVAKKKL